MDEKNSNIIEFVSVLETSLFLCDITTLLPLILNQKKTGLTKTHLNKIAAYVTILNGNENQKSKIILYSYGSHLMNFELAINYLQNNNIVTKQNDKYVLTDSGIDWISNKILELESNSSYNQSQFNKILDQIDSSLFTDVPTLIQKTLSYDNRWGFEQREVNGKNLYLIFDWSKYGTGVLFPYIYTLLYSYSKVEYYFNQRQDNSDISFLHYDDIPDCIQSIYLQRSKNVKNVPLTHVFEKSLPPYLTEEKIEGKNYVANLWYIVEGVNILHALAGVAPTINDIAMLCLTNYQHSAIQEDPEYENLKKIREGLIRNDINKLCDYGILLKNKVNRKYRYSLASKCYYDTILDRKFRIVNEKIIRKIYDTKIRIYNEVRF
jgi:hypothetical protein